jgi:hypothetical protein
MRGQKCMEIVMCDILKDRVRIGQRNTQLGGEREREREREREM